MTLLGMAREPGGRKARRYLASSAQFLLEGGDAAGGITGNLVAPFGIEMDSFQADERHRSRMISQ